MFFEQDNTKIESYLTIHIKSYLCFNAVSLTSYYFVLLSPEAVQQLAIPQVHVPYASRDAIYDNVNMNSTTHRSLHFFIFRYYSFNNPFP